MGLSYNQIHDGAYALMLAEVNGPYRIPVVIGAAEAQAIAVILEGITTPRPLTHDLCATLADAYNIELLEVYISGFKDGIFSATMVFEDEHGLQVEIDSRTSDAIAIALRMDAPIYTTREILEETGFILEKKGPGTGRATGQSVSGVHVEIEWNEDDSNRLEDHIMGTAPRLEDFDVDELQAKMQEAVDNEDYELAAHIKEIINIIKNDSTE